MRQNKTKMNFTSRIGQYEDCKMISNCQAHQKKDLNCNYNGTKMRSVSKM